MPDWIGWIATAVFASSYFCKGPKAMRLTQACAALLWLSYGIVIKAPPVIVANTIVAALAIASTLKPGLNRKVREGGKEI
ncbi:MAG: YgjV family protein [Acidobacteriota bacterium]|nr:MAG: YgjV family protein [Acidobacteriota bacterium]